MIKKVGKKKVAGKDIDHKHPIKKGGGNGMTNLRIRSVKANRGDKSMM
jgi:5-methylcytosine-specific restriction endonuclease McrA